ncbi:hypothetical protein MRB53_028809 [Persea americana]|uniref:Uncharacterized protein n=1 Tax=Persea americana TaxID=3435 RepID=A0ACC2KGL2_PERAE|nr:hypothetical protein MRB53_028809 [Persea americana]
MREKTALRKDTHQYLTLCSSASFVFDPSFPSQSLTYPFQQKLPTRTPERSQAHTPPPNRLEKWRISVLHLGI